MDIPVEFIARSRHYLAYEYPRKIELCLRELPSDALWRRAAEGSNSVANLLLHLEGNIRQWIVSSVGRAPDHRQRSAEFAATEGADAASLFAKLRATLDDADAVIAALTPDDLASRRTIQGRDVSVLDAIYHVVEHMSLHTGQIILLTKLFAPGRIHFYEDAAGQARAVWRDAT
jgi:uncharacterized damage-inducible protein DinB